MAGNASAYAALGLKPGADAAAVESAYKRLIKEHHPDREGGDAKRAAEINRAYRELRPLGRGALELEDFDAGGGEKLWVRIGLLLAVSAIAALLATGPVSSVVRGTGATSARSAGAAAAPAAVTPAAMDEPLASEQVSAAIAAAMHLSRTADELAMADASRACHRRMHQAPSLAMLDRCAAFDNTVVQLQDRDPLRDRGPFSGLAVTGRLMSAATLLSNDYMAIESRLDRIRLEVELALAPTQPDPVIPAVSD